ncbi:acyl-CoA dehydrogenase family protein [Nocardioides sp. WS12]|uniref:acyl-CoA dehydrogenase family protein n=1 Tax=Nocardioides sp. WS12 TaxID=2486272 RepID=UPI0015FDB083|nr:acyl-CoA dehydrogenase family protein [Nocardioides sp. WS12]
MELLTSPELQEFRDEARTWLHENVPGDDRPHDGPGLKNRDEIRAWDAAWQRRQYDGGWAGVDWPKEYGGRGLSLVEQVIWYEELVRAGAPTGFSVFQVALGHAGPTLIARATDEQKAFHLPRILKGESPWCQGFSEPSSGSDLASLRTTGVIDGEELVITGQKMWTTGAQYADYCELLVRTDPDVARHKGLTWVIMEMDRPGVDVRPIHLIPDEYETCEVFYDEVRVPLSNVVDQVNNGWSVAMSTLAIERGPAFLDMRLYNIYHVDELISIARDRGLLADAALADRLAQARADAAAVRSMAYWQISTSEMGVQPGAESTAIRTWHTQLEQRISRLAVDILGTEALLRNNWTRQWLGTFATTIVGGTKDIQKNIIGERVLGLPR